MPLKRCGKEYSRLVYVLLPSNNSKDLASENNVDLHSLVWKNRELQYTNKVIFASHSRFLGHVYGDVFRRSS